VLYLTPSREVVISEFYRLATRQHLSPLSFLPRTFYTYEISLEALLDLRSVEARNAVSLASDDLASDELETCQAVGQAAHACDREGIIVPGAAGNGDVLAVFIARLRPASVVRDVAAELWEQVPSP
jgi:RES domain-containing protein